MDLTSEFFNELPQDPSYSEDEEDNLEKEDNLEEEISSVNCYHLAHGGLESNVDASFSENNRKITFDAGEINTGIQTVTVTVNKRTQCGTVAMSRSGDIGASDCIEVDGRGPGEGLNYSNYLRFVLKKKHDTEFEIAKMELYKDDEKTWQTFFDEKGDSEDNFKVPNISLVMSKDIGGGLMETTAKEQVKGKSKWCIYSKNVQWHGNGKHTEYQPGEPEEPIELYLHGDSYDLGDSVLKKILKMLNWKINYIKTMSAGMKRVRDDSGSSSDSQESPYQKIQRTEIQQVEEEGTLTRQTANPYFTQRDIDARGDMELQINDQGSFDVTLYNTSCLVIKDNPHIFLFIYPEWTFNDRESIIYSFDNKILSESKILEKLNSLNEMLEKCEGEIDDDIKKLKLSVDLLKENLKKTIFRPEINPKWSDAEKEKLIIKERKEWENLSDENVDLFVDLEEITLKINNQNKLTVLLIKKTNEYTKLINETGKEVELYQGLTNETEKIVKYPLSTVSQFLKNLYEFFNGQNIGVSQQEHTNFKDLKKTYYSKSKNIKQVSEYSKTLTEYQKSILAKLIHNKKKENNSKIYEEQIKYLNEIKNKYESARDLIKKEQKDLTRRIKISQVSISELYKFKDKLEKSTEVPKLNTPPDLMDDWDDGKVLLKLSLGITRDNQVMYYYVNGAGVKKMTGKSIVDENTPLNDIFTSQNERDMSGGSSEILDHSMMLDEQSYDDDKGERTYSGSIENIGWVEDNLLPPQLGGGKKSNGLPKLRIISKKNKRHKYSLKDPHKKHIKAINKGIRTEAKKTNITVKKAAISKKARFNVLRSYRKNKKPAESRKLTQDMKYIDSKYKLGKTKKICRKTKGKKTKTKKKQFLYNPDNPDKSFDVYIDKDPSDTIPIKYTTIKDVKNTIQKLERLYKSGKYTHKRIWQVGMIMYVRLKVLKDKKPKQFKLSEKYFKFLGERTKIKGEKERKKLSFKINN